MIDSEKYAKKKLEEKGWKVIKGGAPDFLCIKYDKNNKTKIIDVLFSEVKNDETNDYLKKKQRIYKNALEFLGCKYQLSVVEQCKLCGTFIEKKSNAQKFCKSCSKDNIKNKKLIWEKKNRPFRARYATAISDDLFPTNNEALLHGHLVKDFIIYYDDFCSYCNKKVTNSSVEIDYIHGDIIHRCGCIIGNIVSQL